MKCSWAGRTLILSVDTSVHSNAVVLAVWLGNAASIMGQIERDWEIRLCQVDTSIEKFRKETFMEHD